LSGVAASRYAPDLRRLVVREGGHLFMVTAAAAASTRPSALPAIARDMRVILESTAYHTRHFRELYPAANFTVRSRYGPALLNAHCVPIVTVVLLLLLPEGGC